jgi:hypothetical protein
MSHSFHSALSRSPTSQVKCIEIAIIGADIDGSIGDGRRGNDLVPRGKGPANGPGLGVESVELEFLPGPEKTRNLHIWLSTCHVFPVHTTSSITRFHEVVEPTSKEHACTSST